jgi:cell division protein FtsB
MVSDDREFQKQKEELEARLTKLESERVSLISEVEGLRQKRTLLDLEKKTHSIQETVDMLRKEKEDLEGQISSLESGP